MPQTAEAVIEMIARGEREVEDAMKRVGQSMDQVNQSGSRLQSVMDKVGQGFAKVQANAMKLAAGAAALGVAVYAVNRRSIELGRSEKALEFGLQAASLTWEKNEVQIKNAILTMGKASGYAIPELNLGVGAMATRFRDVNLAVSLTQGALDLMATRGESTIGPALMDLADLAGGSEQAFFKLTQQFPHLEEALMKVGPSMEAVTIIMRDIEGASKDWTTELGKLTANLQLVFDWVIKWNDALGGWPVLIIGAAAAVGALVFALTPLISALIALGGVLLGLSAPVLIIIGILALLGIAALLLWKNWDTVWRWIQVAVTKAMDFLKNSPFRWLLLFWGPFGALALSLGWIAKHWDEIWTTITETTSRIWENLKLIFSGMVDFIKGVFTLDWDRAWGGIVKIFSGVKDQVLLIWGLIVMGVKGYVNVVIGLINTVIRAINKISFTVPDIFGLPNRGERFGVDIEEVQPLQRGTRSFRGGTALVGEAGPELVSLPRGAAVTPMGGMRQVIQLILDGELIAEKVLTRWSDEVRLQGV